MSFLRSPGLIEAAYIVASILFIYGLRRLSHPTTARSGNGIAAVGMTIAIAATLLDREVVSYWLIGLGIVIGTAIGIPAARSVKMTAMPQMVALFNGVGGGAIALISWMEFRVDAPEPGRIPLDIEIPILLALVIGSISFWGSLVAFAKLQELISGRPIAIPGQQVLNGLVVAGILAACVVLATGFDSEPLFIGVLVAAAVLGIATVLPIGGADMPVVISMLNAFTGLSAAAAGFALDNTALIVAGTLVGASGTILTRLMSEAMNRSLANVLFAGFGSPPAVAAAADDDEDRTVRSTSADDVAIQLAYADRVVVVPGYGLAVAQAQHAVRELAGELEKRGVEVSYAIHPVAGRMPGHMNVLLAEADVPYELLKDMDDINPEFPTTDVSLVIGANDVTNPAAREDSSSPIHGMPILDVDRSAAVIVLKRSMSSGFAGIDNPLFYDEKTALLFGDAKESIGDVITEVKALG